MRFVLAALLFLCVWGTSVRSASGADEMPILYQLEYRLPFIHTGD